jgi:hypothetical protein
MSLSPRLPLDVNHRNISGGVNSSNPSLTLPVTIDAATGGVDVNIVGGSGGGGGGTQYTELTTTSPATGTLALGRYEATLPTLTDTQMNEPMLDSSSRLLVNGSGVTQPVSGSGIFTVQDTAAESSLNTIAANTLKPSVNNDTIQGENIAVTAPGSQLVSLAGPTGDPIDTVNDSLSVQVKNAGSVITGNPNQSAQVNVPARLEVPFSTSSNIAVAFTDVSNYRWVSVHTTLASTGGTATWQTSNDGINWTGMALQVSANTGATIPVTGTTGAGMWDGPLHGRYFRLNLTSITAGTHQGVIEFFASPASILQSTSNVASISGTPTDAWAQSTSLEVVNAALVYNGATYDRWRAANIATATTGIGIAATGAMGIYNFTPPNLTDKTYAPLQTDNNGNLKTTLPLGRILSTDTTTIGGDNPALTAEGTHLVSMAGPTGDPVDTVGNALSVDIGKVTANTANNTPGNNLLGAGQMVWNGTSWVRQPADTSGVPKVNSGVAPAGTALNTFSVHLTTNTTTTPTAATAYISTLSISAEVGGTTSSVTIQDKQGTPLKLINGLATTAATTTPTTVNFQTPVQMVGGIDIITAGAVAGTVDVFLNYFQ